MQLRKVMQLLITFAKNKIGMEDLHTLKEELFCTQMESRIFAAYVNYGKLERWMPGFSDPTTEDSHIKRYQFALRYAAHKKVLDMASGCGKGSHVLATEGKASEVDGVDLDADAIRYASHRYAAANLKFQQGDATVYRKENNYDLIVSFETVEHLPHIESYLKNINASLKPDGLFLLSTPLSAMDLDTHPKNPYHVQEWGFKRFQQEVEKYLHIQEVHVQLYPLLQTGFFQRLNNKLKLLLGRPIYQPPKLSTILPFQAGNQNIMVDEFGKRQKGYQILICTKK